MAFVTHNEHRGWACSKHGPFVGPAYPEVREQMVFHPSCPTCKFVHDSNLCVDCEKHDADINFCDGALDYVHGFSERICRCCYLKRVEEDLAKIQANADKLRAELSEKACGRSALDAGTPQV